LPAARGGEAGNAGEEIDAAKGVAAAVASGPADRVPAIRAVAARDERDVIAV